MEKENKYDIEPIVEQIKFKSLPYDIGLNYERLQANIADKEAIPEANNKMRIWRTVGIAASFALILVSALHFINLESSREMVWYETMAVPDAKTKVVLSDSSVVWLNANAHLRYPHSFNENQRNVSMSGDVTFEVRKSEKPFWVELDGINIKVLGTVFNVFTNGNDDEIEITLLEGKIALYSCGNDTDIPNEILTPNQKAIYSKMSNSISVSTVRTEAIKSWVTGIFRFEGNTLAEIAGELERAFHTKIHIENEVMMHKTFNATFEDNETLDEILSILQISARYKLEKRRGEIYIN